MAKIWNFEMMSKGREQIIKIFRVPSERTECPSPPPGFQQQQTRRRISDNQTPPLLSTALAAPKVTLKAIGAATPGKTFKMVGEKDLEITFLTTEIFRNIPTCEITPTEHLLNAGRRPQTSQKARNSPRTWVGQKKKEKTEAKDRDRTCTSGREP